MVTILPHFNIVHLLLSCTQNKIHHDDTSCWIWLLGFACILKQALLSCYTLLLVRGVLLRGTCSVGYVFLHRLRVLKGKTASYLYNHNGSSNRSGQLQ